MNLVAGRCKICRQDIKNSAGCEVGTVFCNGREYARLKVQEQKCPDCNARIGRYHHYACDQEICPSCGGQLLSCNCEDVHFVGLPDDAETQEELRKRYSSFKLNWEEWEVSLVTDKYIFCGYIGDNRRAFRVYHRIGLGRMKNIKNTAMFFEDALWETFLDQKKCEYRSSLAEECLTELKNAMLARLEEN